MQAGLSWGLILKKRDSLKLAFKQFDIKTVSNFDSKDLKRLLNNEKIIRNKLKISAEQLLQEDSKKIDDPRLMALEEE